MQDVIRLVAAVKVAPFDVLAAQSFAKFRATVAPDGDPDDVMIAAIAVTNDFTLVTPAGRLRALPAPAGGGLGWLRRWTSRSVATRRSSWIRRRSRHAGTWSRNALRCRGARPGSAACGSGRLVPEPVHVPASRSEVGQREPRSAPLPGRPSCAHPYRSR